MSKDLAGMGHCFRNDGGVRFNDANVVQTDIETSNGVISVIDTVMLPRG